jgi:hypothetical protein
MWQLQIHRHIHATIASPPSPLSTLGICLMQDVRLLTRIQLRRTTGTRSELKAPNPRKIVETKILTQLR